MELSRAGISIEPTDGMQERASRYEALGYRTLWIAGGQLISLSLLNELVSATRSAVAGTAIIPPDKYPADQVIQTYADLERTAPGRFAVGLGGPQRPKSMQALNAYVDELESVVPRDRRFLAALGPRKLELARERFGGAITLLVNPQFTEQVRVQLGDQGQQIVQVALVFDQDAERARAAGRELLGFLSQVPGYRANFVRMGFTDVEIDRLDDRLVDTVVPWGDPGTIAGVVRQHWDAGADQVAISPLGAGHAEPLAELADLLGLA